MAGKVEVANLALTSLDVERITSLEEDSKAARTISAIWNLTRKSELRLFEWSFAKKEKALALSTETPVLDDYTYCFQLPTDYVKLTKTNLGDTETYKIKGDKIYCNSASLSIEYIADIVDTNLWDFGFIAVFAARLAAEICYALTTNSKLVPVKWEEYRQKRREAKAISSQEISPTQVKIDSWLNSRL